MIIRPLCVIPAIASASWKSVSIYRRITIVWKQPSTVRGALENASIVAVFIVKTFGENMAKSVFIDYKCNKYNTPQHNIIKQMIISPSRNLLKR
jgi:hypothetical protein